LVRLKNTYVIRKIKPFLKRNIARWNETNSKISEQLFQSIPFWIASALTGLLAYLYYLVFRYTEALSFDLVEKYRWSIFILTPISFFISWWLVRRFAPFAKGSGIP
jgi:H+/Cl- antiporter ClcA